MKLKILTFVIAAIEKKPPLCLGGFSLSVVVVDGYF